MSAAALPFRSLRELTAAVAERRVSAVEVTRLYLDRIARHDQALGCFLRLDADGALAQAAAVDAQLAAGSPPLPLCGVPVGLWGWERREWRRLPPVGAVAGALPRRCVMVRGAVGVWRRLRTWVHPAELSSPSFACFCW